MNPEDVLREMQQGELKLYLPEPGTLLASVVADEISATVERLQADRSAAVLVLQGEPKVPPQTPAVPLQARRPSTAPPLEAGAGYFQKLAARLDPE